jgi:hypothetical protein
MKAKLAQRCQDIEEGCFSCTIGAENQLLGRQAALEVDQTAVVVYV